MSKNNVTFQHAEYLAALPAWAVVDDAVSANVESYLPYLNKADESAQNAERNRQYRARAVYYNATRRTLQSLIGAAFRKVPTCTVPSTLEYIKDDIDGNGLSIYQQSQSTLAEVLKKGRKGLLADYPPVEGESTRAQMATGGIRATVASYDAKSVINWRLERFGAVYRYTLVVLYEQASVVTDDGFGEDQVDQYRVLRLTDGVYTQELWRKNGDGGWVLYQKPWVVRSAAGKAWNEIPFTFVGSSNNDSHPDDSPFYDLAKLNIAHFLNSADYEDSAFLCGQPQPWLSGLNENWREHMETQGLYLGSRAPWLLPEGGACGIEQAQPNTLCKEAMDQKEEQMVGLGARLITAGSAVKTATEAQHDNESEHSVLSLAVSNVSEAYTKMAGWMLQFMGGAGEVVYEINQEFTKPQLDAPMLTALVQLWMTGKYPEGDLYDQLRKYGLIDPEKEDESIKEETDSQVDGLGLDE